MTKKLLVLFSLAFFLRFIALNQSLWLDEATTARVIQHFNLWQIVTQFSPHDFHSPLYYLLLKLWSGLFGYSEVALRLPSVLFSLGAGWFVYLLGKKLINQKAGLWAAALFLFNPLIVYYSQEARMYMLATFLLTAALYYYFVILGSIENQVPAQVGNDVVPKSAVVLFNILIFLSFLTFYGSVFLIIALYGHLLYKKQFRSLLLLLPGFVLALLVVFPLLYQQYLNSREQLALVANWRNVLGTVNLKNLLLIPLKFSIGRISWEPKSVYYTVAGLWALFVSWFVVKNYKQDLFYLLLIPLLWGVAFSFFSPLLQYFRFLYLLPIMALLLVMGAKQNWQRIVLLTGFAIFSLNYLITPSLHREDWKSLVRSLPTNQVYMIPSSADPLLYYNPQIKVNDLRQINKISQKEIVVIPYTADIYAVDYKRQLATKGFSQDRARAFRGLSYEVWFKKKP